MPASVWSGGVALTGRSQKNRKQTKEKGQREPLLLPISTSTNYALANNRSNVSLTAEQLKEFYDCLAAAILELTVRMIGRGLEHGQCQGS